MQLNYRLRINYIYTFVIISFLVLASRIIYLQVFQKNFLQNLAQNQYYRLIPIEGKRGTILDRQGRVLASGINTHSVFADPYFIKDPQATATILARLLQLDQSSIEEKLRKKKRFVWIKRKISWPEKEKVRSLKLKGTGFQREQKRFYPQETLAANLLGLVDIDNKGIDGLELYYDNYLRGKTGMVRVLQDSSSQALITHTTILTPKEGFSVELTIDAQIQYWAEIALEETIKKYSAKEGSVVVMDAQTGELLAIANYPFFNPNIPAGVSSDILRNKAVCDMFEPGSVFKVITLIAAVSEGAFKDTDTIFCENGSYKIPGSTLHDWKPYGTLSFKEVFKKSSNIGIGKIANSLGKTTFYNYVKKFGFGEKTGVDIPGEIRGSVKPIAQWSNTSSYIMPIGQEIGVNLIQLTLPFAAVANGGYLVKPHVLKRIDINGAYKEITVERKQVISEAAALRVRNILVEVVDSGTGALAKIEGVTIGGKTGTAQKFDTSIGRYSPTQYRASFVGFISGIDRPIVIGVSVFAPKKSHFGGVVAAPVFRKIAEKVIAYWGKDKFLGQKNVSVGKTASPVQSTTTR